MRDHKKLRAFELADQLALLNYKQTAKLPKDELFGFTNAASCYLCSLKHRRRLFAKFDRRICKIPRGRLWFGTGARIPDFYCGTTLR